MSTHLTRLRRAMTAVASAALLAGLVPAAASAATPTARDITDFACPTAEVPDPGFTDDDDTIHEHAIACIVWYELAGGTSATRYSPNADVNRGQMATFLKNLVVAGGVTMPSNPPDAFDDDDDTTHEKAINQLAALGVVSGTSSTRYSPHASVTRGQMATFLNNAYAEITGARLTSSQDYFTDDAGTTHEDNINAVAEAGIAAGKTSTTYAPNDPVLRDQMASFLARTTDLLVEEGHVTKPRSMPADVLLDQSSVRQGGKVTGRIATQEGVEVTSAKVAGCGVGERTLTLTGTTNAFEFSIPVTQSAGACTLTFTISREDGDDVVDTEEVTVTAADDLTAAPELVSVTEKSGSRTSEKVTLQFRFDEGLNQVSLDRAHFRLYDENAGQETATAVRHGGAGIVEADFAPTHVDAATTATVVAAAVEDASNIPNPEGAVSLQQPATTLSATDAPDLTAVTRIGSTDDWLFVFDEAVEGHPGGNGNYHLVLDDGRVLTASAQTGEGQKSDERKVTFGDVPSGQKVVRGYIDAGTVSDEPQDDNPLDGAEGNTNPTQAAEVSGGGDSPYLVKVVLKPGDNQVVYTFNRAVTLVSKNVTSTEVFRAYDKAGDEVSTNDATASGSTVTASFSGTNPINSTTVGASVLEDAVRAATGTKLPNEVDERLPDTASVMPGNQGGETVAPDLQTVERTVSGNNTVLVFTFDAPVSQVLDSDAGALAMYQPDGTRTVLDLNALSGNECSTSSNEVRCSAGSSSTLGQLMESAVLGGVEHRAVSSGGSSPEYNYESSAPIN